MSNPLQLALERNLTLKKIKNIGFYFLIRIFEKNIRVMTTKLTLTVEKEIIEKSKSFAKKTGTSLSNIVENYLASIVEEKQNAQVSEKLSKIVGKVKLPDSFDEERELKEYLEKKHL